MIPVEILREKGAVVKQVHLGEIIYFEGSTVLYYYQIIKGTVRLCNFLDDGKEVLQRIVGENECFGETVIFEGGNHVATAVADSTCVFFRISKEVFFEILAQHQDFHGHFIQYMAKNLRFKMFLTKLICSGSPKEILLNLILYLNQHSQLVCAECKRLMLTRQQLANMTGLRVETVIRTMKELQKSSKLTIVKGKVFIPADGLD